MTQETVWVNLWRSEASEAVMTLYSQNFATEREAREKDSNVYLCGFTYLGPFEVPVPKKKVKKKITLWGWLSPNGYLSSTHSLREATTLSRGPKPTLHGERFVPREEERKA